MRIVIGGLALAALLLVATGPAQAQELIVNGGFETGSFAPWVNGGDTSFTGVTGDHPHTGNFAAHLGPLGPTEGTLTQTIATTAGQMYHESYWLRNDGGNPNSFRATINGVTVAGTALTNAPGFEYTATGAGMGHVEFDFTATGASTVVGFAFVQNPAYYDLDDVSVMPSPIPEPASLTLFGLGLVPLAGYAWRRRQKAAG
jgi:hypothetical protein